MRVAVCEDQREEMEQVCTILREYDQPERFEIERFFSGNELLTSAEETAYDIAILDIEMAPNGFDAALKLAELPTPPLIIFTSQSMRYTIQGYGVAFRYIPKPVTPEKLSPALDAAIREIRANRFCFSIDGTAYILRMQEIVYFEVYDHVTTVHTADGNKYSLRITLKQALSQLPKGCFGMPHQSYIVNLAHVKTATTRQITLTHGVRIPVSRRRQVDFMWQLQTYLGRGF